MQATVELFGAGQEMIGLSEAGWKTLVGSLILAAGVFLVIIELMRACTREMKDTAKKLESLAQTLDEMVVNVGVCLDQLETLVAPATQTVGNAETFEQDLDAGQDSGTGFKLMTVTREWISLLEPTPDQVAPEAVLWGLAREQRWSGQYQPWYSSSNLSQLEFYSVAEHTLLMYAAAKKDNVGQEVLRAILLHDATEAYLKDLPRPIKHLLGSKYKDLEARFAKAIGSRFGVDISLHQTAIQFYDNLIVQYEEQEIIGRPVSTLDRDYTQFFANYEGCLEIQGMMPIEAKHWLTNAFKIEGLATQS